MKCLNCGADVPENALFCTSCGFKIEKPQETPVAEPVVETSAEPVAETPVVETPVEPVAETPVVETPVEPVAETPVVETPTEPVIEAPAEPVVPVQAVADVSKAKEKNNKVFIIAGVAIAAVVVIALIVGIANMLGGSKNSKSLVYRKDDKIYFVKDASKAKEPYQVYEIDMDRSMDEEDESGCTIYSDSHGYSEDAIISDDGKYVYFFGEIDDYGEGTLYRTATSKLGKNSDKNEKKAEEIADKVSYANILSNNSIICMTEDDEALYFDGKSTEKIGDCYTDSLSKDEKKLLYYCGDGDDYELHVFDFSKKKDEEIEDGIDRVVTIVDDMFICMDEKKNDKGDLYAIDLKGKKTEIADDVYSYEGYSSETKTFYYLKADTKKVSLYDFVDDPYAADDKNLKEPVEKDFMKQVTGDEVVGPEASQQCETDFETFRLYNALWLDSELEMYEYYRYSQDYSEYELFYYDLNTHTWYKYDRDAYEEAVDKYYDAEDRIETREELQDEEYEYSVYDVATCELGKKEKILVEGVGSVYVNPSMDFVSYMSVGDVKGTCGDIEDVYMYEVMDFVDEQVNGGNENEVAQYTYKGKSGKLDLDKGEKVTSCGESKSGNAIYIVADKLYYAETSKGEVKKTKELCDCSDYYYGVRFIDDTLYYVDDSTLYSYDGKDKNKLYKNYRYGVSFDSGVSLVLDDNDTLKLYDKKGNDTKIAKDVETYRMLDDKSKTVVYMKDSDLYVYTGKEDVKIDKDVISFYCQSVTGDYYPTR